MMLAVRAFLITLVVVLAVVFAIDRLAPLIAEGQLADKVRSYLDSDKDPDVDIHGFPFLNQAFGGEYDDIEVTLQDASLKGLPEADFSAHLHGVEVPFSDAISGSIDKVPVRDAVGTVTLPYDAAAEELGRSDLTFADAGAGLLRVSGQSDVLGMSADFSAETKLSIEDGAIALDIQSATVGGQDLPDDLVSVLGDQLGLHFDVPELPFGIQLDDATAASDGLRLRAVGHDLVLG